MITIMSSLQVTPFGLILLARDGPHILLNLPSNLEDFVPDRPAYSHRTHRRPYDRDHYAQCDHRA